MVKEARIYLADESKAAIVVAMHHNFAGLYYEQENPITISNWRDSPELALALRSALHRFSLCDRNLRELKSSDWTAYRVSRCRSVREFQGTYLRISVRAANEAELCYIAEAQPLDEDEVSLHILVDRIGDEEITRRLLRLYDVCSRWSSIAI